MAGEPTGFSDFVTADILGEGGMGRVYKARQLSLDRWVALKVLPAAKDKKFSDRFVREARSAARLVHPNIVQIYTVGEAKGIPFYSMEYIEGEDLENILRVTSDPLTQDETIEVIRCVTKALSLAMEHAIVHRDIKPANIMITRSGLVKVMDFGLAKGLGAADQGLTQAGLVVGTPTYMSPEQGASRPVDSRSDLYSVGCVLYYCLTGQPPFVADNVASLLYKHMFEKPESPSVHAPNVNPALEALCMKMLEKKPEDRYQSPMDVLEALAMVPSNSALGELQLSKRSTKAWQARKGVLGAMLPAGNAGPFAAGQQPVKKSVQPDTDVVPMPQPFAQLTPFAKAEKPASKPELPAPKFDTPPPKPISRIETPPDLGPPPKPGPDSSAAQTVVRLDAVVDSRADVPQTTLATEGESVDATSAKLTPVQQLSPLFDAPPMVTPPSSPLVDQPASFNEPFNEEKPLTPAPVPISTSSPRGISALGPAAVPPAPVPPPPAPPRPSASSPRVSISQGAPPDLDSGIRKPLGRVDDNFVRLPDGRWSYRVEGGSCKFAEGLATNLNPVPPMDAEKLGDCLLCSNWNKRTGCTLASCQELEAVRRYKGLKLATEQSILWVGALRFDRAIGVWDAYIKTNPDDPEGYRELARVYDWPEYTGKDKRRAVVLYRRFAELARGSSKFSQVEIARAEERAGSMMGTAMETKSSLISPSMGVAFHGFYRGAIVCFGYGVLTPERMIFARAGEIDPESGIVAADMGGAYGRATTIFRRFKSENAKREEQNNVRKELARLSSLGLDELVNDPSRILVLPCDQMQSVDVVTDTAINVRCVKIRSAPSHDLLFPEATYFKADQVYELLRRRLAVKA